MRKLKRLWLIGLGLLLLVVWLWPFVYVQYALASIQKETIPLTILIIRTIGVILSAFGALRFFYFWWNYVGYAGLALIFTGLSRLVCSLRESRS